MSNEYQERAWDEFVMTQAAEIRVSLDKVLKSQTPHMVVYHCGRITAASWALCRYVIKTEIGTNVDETDYIRPKDGSV